MADDEYNDVDMGFALFPFISYIKWATVSFLFAKRREIGFCLLVVQRTNFFSVFPHRKWMKWWIFAIFEVIRKILHLGLCNFLLFDYFLFILLIMLFGCFFMIEVWVYSANMIVIWWKVFCFVDIVSPWSNDFDLISSCSVFGLIQVLLVEV